MSYGESKSESSSSTANINEDNRQAVDNQSVALGKDATLMISNNFDDNVRGAFSDLVSLVRDAGQVVVSTSKNANENTQSTVNAVTAALQNEKLGTASVFQNMVPLLLGAAVLIFLFGFVFKRK